jgi:hypothetical protein
MAASGEGQGLAEVNVLLNNGEPAAEQKCQGMQLCRMFCGRSIASSIHFYSGVVSGPGC